MTNSPSASLTAGFAEAVLGAYRYLDALDGEPSGAVMLPTKVASAAWAGGEPRTATPEEA